MTWKQFWCAMTLHRLWRYSDLVGWSPTMQYPHVEHPRWKCERCGRRWTE